MSVFAVFTYNVTDPERYAQYNPGSLPIVGATIAKHGGEIVFADGDAIYEAGDKKHVNVCIKFPDEAALHAWMEDPEYGAIKGHRVEASDNYTVFFVEKKVFISKISHLSLFENVLDLLRVEVGEPDGSDETLLDQLFHGQPSLRRGHVSHELWKNGNHFEITHLHSWKSKGSHTD